MEKENITKDDIFNLLKEMLIELFEIDESKISLESRFFEDLELDSIDAIDLVEQIRKKTGYKMEASDFKEVRQIKDIVDIVYAQLQKDSKNV